MDRIGFSANRFDILLFLIILMASCLNASLIRLVSKCTTKSGVGRCATLPSSCMDMGGVVEDEIPSVIGRSEKRGVNTCSDDEICCMLAPIPYSDSCNVCGKKGNEPWMRRSTLERHLDNLGTFNQLRVLRSAEDETITSSEAEIPRFNGDEKRKMGRIMNGDNAEKNEWCWQVALLNADGSVLGSGSLIDGRYVLTAAHKLAGKNSSNLVIVIGQYDFSSPITSFDDNNTIWYTKPQEIIIHERYNPETLDNDVALIRIPMVSCHSENVCPVCVNDITDKLEFMTTLSNCYITGWGASSIRTTSPVLQESRFRILDMPECRKRFAALGLIDVQLPDSAFCAEGQPSQQLATSKLEPPPVISTCSGDGGGPLVCETPDGKWRLMGLIAMGLDECKQIRTAAPTVFVNVARYADWISSFQKSKQTIVDFVPANAGIESNQIYSNPEPKFVKIRRIPKSVERSSTTTDPNKSTVATTRRQFRNVFGRSL